MRERGSRKQQDLGNSFTVCHSKNDLNVQVRLFERGHFRVRILMPTPSFPLFFFIPITTHENGTTSMTLSFNES